jgi:hypothetical protein
MSADRKPPYFVSHTPLEETVNAGAVAVPNAVGAQLQAP